MQYELSGHVTENLAHVARVPVRPDNNARPPVIRNDYLFTGRFDSPHDFKHPRLELALRKSLHADIMTTKVVIVKIIFDQVMVPAGGRADTLLSGGAPRE